MTQSSAPGGRRSGLRCHRRRTPVPVVIGDVGDGNVVPLWKASLFHLVASVHVRDARHRLETADEAVRGG